MSWKYIVDTLMENKSLLSTYPLSAKNSDFNEFLHTFRIMWLTQKMEIMSCKVIRKDNLPGHPDLVLFKKTSKDLKPEDIYSTFQLKSYSTTFFRNTERLDKSLDIYHKECDVLNMSFYDKKTFLKHYKTYSKNFEKDFVVWNDFMKLTPEGKRDLPIFLDNKSFFVKKKNSCDLIMTDMSDFNNEINIEDVSMVIKYYKEHLKHTTRDQVNEILDTILW